MSGPWDWYTDLAWILQEQGHFEHALEAADKALEHFDGLRRFLGLGCPHARRVRGTPAPCLRGARARFGRA